MGKGALVFKGDKPKKKKTKAKHETEKPSSAATASAEDHDTSLSSESHPPQYQQQPPSQSTPHQPKIQTGRGKITTSGTVVTGHDTQFQRQIQVGDALLVHNEMRVVTMCLSNTSINLSSAFSQSLTQPTEYQFISKPRAKPSAQATAAHKRQKEQDESKSASGTYASNSELVYREKTEQGSYRIVKKSLDHDASRGDLLEMRTKKKSDKYC